MEIFRDDARLRIFDTARSGAVVVRMVQDATSIAGFAHAVARTIPADRCLLRHADESDGGTVKTAAAVATEAATRDNC